ncbi:MAG TPA: GNAT family N-acetyltransferase [Deltaproteobacteria bacterium]|nr:GNAT family N-acetyltransferase [Deltaproteobacteria bacterium]HPR55722.1 GNAT family N-acetyltransferase [Deltaproteobacteria bacterium]HXK47331.1 GNAT family N-acetyltransferase [Deltaproteobacteria bacterium]
MKLSYRETVLPSDLRAVREVVESTGFFTGEEVDVAVELVDAGLQGQSLSGYYFIFCEDGSGALLGYTCFGPVICTEGSFDLYWIAVHPDRQGSGIGGDLLARTEEKIRTMGGARIYIETASRDLYKPTQGFYMNAGYEQEAVLKDYYSKGDSKIIYVKHLG